MIANSIALQDVRDLVIVIWGAISILLTLVMLIVVAAILYFGRKGMKAVHGQFHKRVEPAVERASKLVTRVESVTSTLPGAPGATGGIMDFVQTLRGAKETIDDTKPPFRSRRRVWLPFR